MLRCPSCSYTSQPTHGALVHCHGKGTGSVTHGRDIPPTLNVVAAHRGRFCVDATVLPQLGHIGGRGRYQPNHSHAPIEAAAEHPAVVVRPILELRRRLRQLAESLRGLVAMHLHSSLQYPGFS